MGMAFWGVMGWVRDRREGDFVCVLQAASTVSTNEAVSTCLIIITEESLSLVPYCLAIRARTAARKLLAPQTQYSLI